MCFTQIQPLVFSTSKGAQNMANGRSLVSGHLSKFGEFLPHQTKLSVGRIHIASTQRHPFMLLTLVLAVMAMTCLSRSDLEPSWELLLIPAGPRSREPQ